MKDCYLTIIIPTLESAGHLPAALIDIDRGLAGSDFNYEILVADAGSGDQSREVTEKLRPFIKNLRLISSPKEQKGKSRAVERARESAKGGFILLLGPEMNIPIENFFKMIPYLSGKKTARSDVVLGSRNIEPDKRKSKPRRILRKIKNWFIKMASSVDSSDISCYFKCLSKEAASRIFPLLGSRGDEFHFEALILAKKMNYRIKEVAVLESRADRREPRLARLLWSLLKIRLNLKKRRL